MLKRAVLESRNVGISLKKRRFLKLICVFIGIKTVYCSDYQHLLCNVKNKRFLSSDDSTPANIGGMHAYNSLFVKFIHSIRKHTEKTYHGLEQACDSEKRNVCSFIWRINF